MRFLWKGFMCSSTLQMQRKSGQDKADCLLALDDVKLHLKGFTDDHPDLDCYEFGICTYVNLILMLVIHSA